MREARVRTLDGGYVVERIPETEQERRAMERDPRPPDVGGIGPQHQPDFVDANPDEFEDG